MSGPASTPDSELPRRRRRPGASGLVLDQVERWTALSLGVADVVTSYSATTLAAVEPEAESSLGEASEEPADLHAADLVRVALGAAGLLTLRAQSRAFDAVASTESAVAGIVAKFGAIRITSRLATRAYERLAELDVAFTHEQARRAEVAEDFLAAAGPRTLEELLSRIDLDAVLARIDMNALLERVDVDALLDRMDLDAALGRMDLDAALGRMDLEAVLGRVDFNDFMSGVLQEIQVAGLLRDSTGALANTTVGVLRNQVGGVANRLTGRK